MYKLLITLLFVSTNCSAEFLTHDCTEKMIREHSARLRAEVKANVKYPVVALRRGMSGYGIAQFEYSNDNPTPTDVKIIQSTGYRVLDDAIVDGIKTSYLPMALCDLPIEKIAVRVPVYFILHEPKVKKPTIRPKPLHESLT